MQKNKKSNKAVQQQHLCLSLSFRSHKSARYKHRAFTKKKKKKTAKREWIIANVIWAHIIVCVCVVVVVAVAGHQRRPRRSIICQRCLWLFSYKCCCCCCLFYYYNVQSAHTHTHTHTHPKIMNIEKTVLFVCTMCVLFNNKKQRSKVKKLYLIVFIERTREREH